MAKLMFRGLVIALEHASLPTVGGQTRGLMMAIAYAKEDACSVFLRHRSLAAGKPPPEGWVEPEVVFSPAPAAAAAGAGAAEQEEEQMGASAIKHLGDVDESEDAALRVAVPGDLAFPPEDATLSAPASLAFADVAWLRYYVEGHVVIVGPTDDVAPMPHSVFADMASRKHEEVLMISSKRMRTEVWVGADQLGEMYDTVERAGLNVTVRRGGIQATYDAPEKLADNAAALANLKRVVADVEAAAADAT